MDDSPRQPLPFRLLLRIPVPWVFVLGYLGGVALESALAWGGNIMAIADIRVAGATLFAVGGCIASWGLLTFRRARTTTVPGERSSKLVTWGPYRRTRNPMYVGLILAYIGEAGILRQTGPLVVLPFVVAYVNWIVIPLEESKLSDAFGSQYDAYRARVRRWI